MTPESTTSNRDRGYFVSFFALNPKVLLILDIEKLCVNELEVVLLSVICHFQLVEVLVGC